MLTFIQEEKKLFMERLNGQPADGQWGIFSMAISGRVGYQVKDLTFFLVFFYNKIVEKLFLKRSLYYETIF